jgi:hypothetical protein
MSSTRDHSRFYPSADGVRWCLPEFPTDIHVVEFIAEVVKYDFSLVTRGIAEGLGIKDWAAPQGAVLS